MVQVVSDYMEIFVCCFDIDGIQEDGNSLKGLYVFLRFFVFNFVKISFWFFKVCCVVQFEFDKIYESDLKIVQVLECEYMDRFLRKFI